MARVLSLLTVLLTVASCQSYENLKQKYFAPETPWAHLQPPPGPPVDAMAGRCGLPIHDDDYYGFSVGRPDGWQLDYSTGTLVVSRDESSMVGALVYPARMQRTDVPPEQLASRFADNLGSRIKMTGGTFELVNKITDGRVATALALATINGVKLRGPLQVVETPGFVTLKFYWAPEAELAQDEPTLRQVVACFHRKTLITRRAPVAPPGGPQTTYGGAAPASRQARPAALEPYRGRFVAMSVPPGWQVVDETEHGIDLIAKDRSAAFGFVWIIGQNMRADLAIQQTMRTRYAGTQVVSQAWLPAPPGWQIAAVEFTGSIGGYPTHGYLRVAVGGGVLLSSDWLAGTQSWDRLKPTLEAMAASAQIQPAAINAVRADVRRQLASYPPIKPSTVGTAADPTNVWSSWSKMEDRQSLGYQDTMLQQDHARSPSTGEAYTVPWNAWSDTGPQGAGYYRQVPGGGTERLDVDPQ